MLTCWSLDNIRKHKSFYKEFDLLMLFASVRLWKKNHPEDTCVLYADSMTKGVIKDLSADYLWDEIRLLGDNKFIDKNIFWASSKLQALRYIEEPVTILDTDFLAYKPLNNLLKGNITVAHDENGIGYYPGPLDPYIRQVRHLVNRPNHRSVNCCFVHIPDPTFTQYYAKNSLLLMEEFTKLRVPSSNYLVFAEQLYLKHLFDIHNIQYDTLLSQTWHCNDGYFYDNKKEGLLPEGEEHLYYRHYWMEKPMIRESAAGYVYEEEIKQLRNILGRSTKVDIKKLQDVYCR